MYLDEFTIRGCTCGLNLVGVVNVYTMVPCHKIAAALGELYQLGASREQQHATKK
jgi:hypothetical protein